MDNHKVGEFLISLTQKLCESGKVKEGGYCLGGRYGYGEDFENDVFKMHRFCWCDCDDCPYCDGTEPNFFHKPSGSYVIWYKYIGRDMEGCLNDSLENIAKDCFKSIEET